jgi:hypothetical protein
MTTPERPSGSATPRCKVCLKRRRNWVSLFKRGWGVTEDKFEAYVWLLVSFDAGSHIVAADLAALQGELGANRVDEAKSKARDLEQTSSRTVVSRGCSGWPGEFNLVPRPPPPDIQRFCC